MSAAEERNREIVHQILRSILISKDMSPSSMLAGEKRWMCLCECETERLTAVLIYEQNLRYRSFLSGPCVHVEAAGRGFLSAEDRGVHLSSSSAAELMQQNA
jgi:hypothetical protein